MATLKAVVRTPRADGFYPVYIRVTHQRVSSFIKTDKMVTRKELTKTNEIKDPYVLQFCTQKILEYNDRLNKKDTEHWTVKEVVEFLLSGNDDICFSDYARKVYIPMMIDRGQERNARNYTLALQHLERFMGTSCIMFSHLTSQAMNRWIKSLENTHRAKEMYPICMRQVFKAAQLEYNDYDIGLIRIKTNPWVKVVIPSADKAEKLAITPEACRRFFEFEVDGGKRAAYRAQLGQDVAMLSFCLAGMNTVDIFKLRKGDLRGDVLRYCRSKTASRRRDGAYFEIKVNARVASLIEKYAAEEGSPYLLRFSDAYSDARSFNASVNDGIQQVCEWLGLMREDWYSVYTFRHTWATVARNNCGASLSEVGFAMNHLQSDGVTRGYIKIDFSPAWELNERVIDFVFEQKRVECGVCSTESRGDFVLSPRDMVYARGYFRGEVVAEVDDIGFTSVDDVAMRLLKEVAGLNLSGGVLMFRIRNVDADCEVVLQRKV